MKKVFATVLGGLVVILFNHCGATKSLNDIEDDLVDLDNKTVTKEIEYSHGGWMPAPNTPNYSLKLNIKIDDQGKAYAKAQSPACTASAYVNLGKYKDLETLALNSEFELGKNHMADAGDEKLVLRSKTKDYKFFLRDGDSAYNQPIIDEAEAAVIRLRVQDIADEVFDKAKCDLDPHRVTKIHIRENVGVKLAATLPANTTVIITNLAVDVYSEKVVLTGVNQKVTATKVCSSTFSDKVINDKNLADAARKVEIVHSGMICEMAMVELPGISNWSHRSFELKYADQLQTEKGYFTCMYSNRIFNGKDFEDQLAKYIKNTTCVNR